jgi:hypothetical protein
VARVADTVLDELATWVAKVMPEIADRIPTGAAVELGRLAKPAGARFTDDYDDYDAFAEIEVDVDRSPVLGELGALNPLLAERLFGALELTVERLDLAGAPDLAA